MFLTMTFGGGVEPLARVGEGVCVQKNADTKDNSGASSSPCGRGRSYGSGIG
jgi:hypothetical protein